MLHLYYKFILLFCNTSSIFTFQLICMYILNKINKYIYEFCIGSNNALCTNKYLVLYYSIKYDGLKYIYLFASV